jgi:serine/threonine protein kinase
MVYLGNLFNMSVAVKAVSLRNGLCDDEINISLYQSTIEEIKFLRKLSHENIVLYIGGYLGNHDMLCIVMEFVGNGTLNQWIYEKFKKESNKNILKATKLKFSLGIAQGMEYIHSQNITHRDLKPENVLISEDMIPKVADFGLSKSFDSDNTSWKSVN